ncbi:MAG: cytochrome c1, partial [Gammaproteobacteria bacterium]
EQVTENLMFASDKVSSLMTVAMDAKDAKNWFGTSPPDLSLSSRARGVDWLYTYLRSFYLDNDPSRPFGVNNLVFKDVAMPHVLWELQGSQKAVYKTELDHEGHEHQVIEKLELVEPGTLSVSEYDRAVQDLVTFMSYLGEPIKLERRRIGVWVLLFLAVFFVVALMLKKEYWKDVH